MATGDKTYAVQGVTASTPTDFIAPAAGTSFKTPLARFTNTGGVAGNLTVTVTNAAGAVQATLVSAQQLAAGATWKEPALSVLNPNKIRVTFTQTTLDCYALGTEA